MSKNSIIPAFAVWISTIAVSSLAFILFIFISFSFPAYAQEDENSVSLEPQNGIPLMIVRVDESRESIAAAGAEDPDHSYGTIQQMHESKDHSVRCVGTIEIIVPGTYKGEYGSVSVPKGEVPLDYIRGRGNMTWSMGIKKPYKIKLDEAADLFGMGESKEWGLLANSMDPTLLKNRITHWLGTEVGLNYTPQMIPMDLVMIGSESGSAYLGSYCLSELIDIEEERISIPKLKKDAVSATDDISGGYLLSIHNTYQDSDIPESSWFTTPKGGVRLTHETPSFDDDPLKQGQIEQREYIQQYINRLDELIMTDEEKIDEARHKQIDELLDLTSAADYWWIQEFSKNGDAFNTGSTYLYKEQNGKLFFGPLWDFDIAWMGLQDGPSTSAQSFNNSKMIWIDRLRERDPYFVELLKSRWNVMKGKLAELTEKGGTLDRYRDEISLSRKEDEKKWGPGSGDEEDESNHYDSVIDSLKRWINVRRSWVDNNIDKLSTVYFTISYEVDGEIIKTEKVRGEDVLDRGMRLPDRDDQTFMGWVEKETNESRNDYTVRSDVTFVPTYKALADMVQPTDLFFNAYEVYERFTAGYYDWINVKVLPLLAQKDALDCGVWTSSDESIASVNSNGRVDFKTTGDVTITFTLFNGLQKSYLLHIYDPEQTRFVPPSAMTVSPASITLKQGDVFQIETLFESEHGPCTLLAPLYSSTDDSVANVDYLGIVTAKNPGTSTIVIEGFFAGDVEGEKREPLTATCEVTVTESDPMK